MLPSFQFALMVRFDCSIKVYNLYSRIRAGEVYPHEIDIQETHTKHRKLDSQATLSHRARGRAADGLRPKAWPLSPCGPARLFSATYSSPHGAAPPSRHTVRSRPRRRWHPVRLALPRADRGVRRKHQPALWFGRLERGRRRNFYGRRFYRSLEQFDRAASLRCKRGLDVLDHGFKLLVRQAFERIAVLDLVLAGNEQAENLEIARRLLPRDLLNCLLAVLAEMQQQRLHELLIEQVTRAVPVATRVSILGGCVLGNADAIPMNLPNSAGDIRWYHSHSPRRGGTSIISGQDGSGVHRLR